jgi:hypothetical protein
MAMAILVCFHLINAKEEIHLKKLLAALVAGAFAIASVGVFAAAHTGAQPAKDGKKDEMKKDDAKKDAKKEDKKDEMKKDDKKK